MRAYFTALTCHVGGCILEEHLVLRNGLPIQTHGGDSNFIMSSTGHLLILQARLEDTANYTCVAANIARQRTSPKALVTVYSEYS